MHGLFYPKIVESANPFRIESNRMADSNYNRISKLRRSLVRVHINLFMQVAGSKPTACFPTAATALSGARSLLYSAHTHSSVSNKRAYPLHRLAARAPVLTLNILSAADLHKSVFMFTVIHCGIQQPNQYASIDLRA